MRIHGTNIIVDNFKFSQNCDPFQYIYFLSHLHSDHYVGITNEWQNGLIYCSY